MSTVLDGILTRGTRAAARAERCPRHMRAILVAQRRNSSKFRSALGVPARSFCAHLSAREDL